MKYRETNAVQYRPEGGPTNRVSKHKQKNKALEIVFDPKHHKEYITGFRKRKQQRRKDALQKLESIQRQQRLEERAERRHAKDELHKRLGIRVDGAASSGDEQSESEEEEDVKVYQSGQLTSTVTVTAIHNSDSDVDAADGGSPNASDAEAPSAVGGNAPSHLPLLPPSSTQHKQQKQQQRAQQQGGAGGKPRKMSKQALRVMAKTKMKLEGKKGRGTQAGFAKNLASKKKFKSKK